METYNNYRQFKIESEALSAVYEQKFTSLPLDMILSIYEDTKDLVCWGDSEVHTTKLLDLVRWALWDDGNVFMTDRGDQVSLYVDIGGKLCAKM